MALDVKLGTEELRLLLETGYLLAERREFAKAKEVFEAVEAIGQGADVAQMGLAHVHLVSGNQKEAEKYLKAAVKANPTNAFAHSQLGELLYTLGKKDEAAQSLKEAESLDKNGPVGEYARAVRQAMDTGLEYRYRADKPGAKGPKK